MTPKRLRVLLAVPHFLPHDAVGNDVLGMAECCEAASYATTILAQTIHPSLEKRALRIDKEPSATWKNPDHILIYHHAFDWQAGESLLANTANRLVVKYHNVTPPSFYERYSEGMFQECQRGAAFTQRIARHPQAWFWGDSSFNAGGLIEAGAPPERCRVLPPLHCVETELASMPFDSAAAGDCRKAYPNILFVGAFRPNKGHLKALEVFAAYRHRSDAPARLIFAGSFNPILKAYVEKIQQRAIELGVLKEVHFAFSPTPSRLRSYYMASSVFLCTSEHEGFCVPLIESMYFRLPIVAWGTTAVKETCAEAAIVFEDFDPARMAESIEECVENPILAGELARRGRERYDREFRPGAIQQRLLNLLDEVMHSPMEHRAGSAI